MAHGGTSLLQEALSVDPSRRRLEYYGYDIPWAGSIILRSLWTGQSSPTSPQVI